MMRCIIPPNIRHAIPNSPTLQKIFNPIPYIGLLAQYAYRAPRDRVIHLIRPARLPEEKTV